MRSMSLSDESTGGVEELFSLRNRTAIVTGGTGVLGSTIARGLALAGARVSVLGRRRSRGEEIVRNIESTGGEAMVLQADVLDRDEFARARDDVLARWGQVDILVNAAGGNVAGAVVEADVQLFDRSREALEEVFDLNVIGGHYYRYRSSESVCLKEKPGEAS